MSLSYVIDTHAFIWHLQSSSRLSSTVKQIFAETDEGKIIVIVPTIVLVEMIYLAEKSRIPQNIVNIALQLLGKESANYQLAPLNFEVVESLKQIPRSVVPDMPDRIISATALALKLPLLSKDSAILRLLNIKVIW